VIRSLLFSTLYPNAVHPAHGIFVETRLRGLMATGQVSARALAPVPWFPSRNQWFGEYAKLASVPLCELRHGIHIDHPRYLTIPKVGMNIAPFLMAASLKPHFDRIMASHDSPHLIDAHYFYPDGVAAVLLGRHYGKPVVVTGRGTDLHCIPKYTIPRLMIRFAANKSSAIITVCQALKETLIGLQIPEKKIVVLKNGVDLSLFRPLEDRDCMRKKLGLTGTTLISVGRLIALKGHHLIIEALKELPDCDLLIAGSGPEDKKLRKIAKKMEVEKRVRFLGPVPHDNLANLYGAADMLVLASDREGWANVLLESMACGTPVVATRVWGTSEVVTSSNAGILIDNREARSIADGVRRLLSAQPDRDLTRKHAEGFSWDATTEGQLRIFRQVTGLAASL
jgi:teichuronic acid biosynthesis glycosyltransferase TuaC